MPTVGTQIIVPLGVIDPGACIELILQAAINPAIRLLQNNERFV